MTKSLSLCGLLIVASMCLAFQGKRYVVSRDEARYKKENEAIAQLNALFSAHQYDSAIRFCNRARKESLLDYSTLELALATACWYKNDRSTAYLYVQNSADYIMKLSGGGGDPFHMLRDYTFGPALASDTFLNRLITMRLSDYYRSLDYYPERSTGLKLMLLNEQLQRCRDQYAYEKRHLPKEQLPQAEERYHEAMNEWSGQFMALLQDNQKLFTRSAIGPAAEKQMSMILNLDKPEYLKACLPLVQQACQAGDLSTDSYVEALIAECRLTEPDKLDESRMRDSLCRIHRCRSVIYDSTGRGYSYYEGKYITMKSDTLFYRSSDSTKTIIVQPYPVR